MDYQLEQQELGKVFSQYFDLANNRVPWAQSWIADAYFWGWGVKPDFTKFVEWDTKAARNGSLMSARRMLLYYQSIGSYSASATLFGIYKEKVLAYGFLYSDDVGFYKVFANRSIYDMVSAYERGENPSHERIETDKTVLDDATLLKVICYIYGFGGKQSFQESMEMIKTLDRKHIGYGDIRDIVHYYWCMREVGIPASPEMDKEIWEDSPYKYAIFEEEDFDAYKIRHYIRKAIEGDAHIAGEYGDELRESRNKPGVKSRRMFYHNNASALYYLSMGAGINPLSDSTYYAIGLSSNPDLNSFNFDYARNLCFKTDAMLDNAQQNEDDKSKSLVRVQLVQAYADLARSTADENVKRDFGNRALIQCQKNAEFGTESMYFFYGIVYFECFHDYNTAIRYFNAISGNDEKVERYRNLCKKFGAKA